MELRGQVHLRVFYDIQQNNILPNETQKTLKAWHYNRERKLMGDNLKLVWAEFTTMS